MGRFAQIDFRPLTATIGVIDAVAYPKETWLRSAETTEAATTAQTTTAAQAAQAASSA